MGSLVFELTGKVNCYRRTWKLIAIHPCLSARSAERSFTLSLSAAPQRTAALSPKQLSVSSAAFGTLGGLRAYTTRCTNDRYAQVINLAICPERTLSNST